MNTDEANPVKNNKSVKREKGSEHRLYPLGRQPPRIRAVAAWWRLRLSGTSVWDSAPQAALSGVTDRRGRRGLPEPPPQGPTAFLGGSHYQGRGTLARSAVMDASPPIPP